MSGTIERNVGNLHDQTTGKLVGYRNPVTGKEEELDAEAIQASVSGAGIVPAAAYSQRFSGDTSAGTLGDGWQLLGSGALAPATQGQLVNGVFTAPAGSVVYATRDLKRPVNWIGARIGWLTGNGGGGATTAAFLITPVNTAPGLIANSAIHGTVTRSQLAIGYIRNQVIVDVGVFPLPRTIPIGEEIVVEFQIDGNYVVYSVDGLVGRFKMPIASAIGLGSNATWEIFHGGSSNADQVYFAEVWGGARAPSRHGLRELCVAAWNFESNSWLDSSGEAVTLTGVNTPTVAAGKLGNAVSLVGASSQHLTLADTHNVQFAGKDFTLVAWVNPTALPSGGQFMGIFTKGSTTTLGLTVFLDSAGRINALMSPTGVAASGVQAISTDTIPAGAWSMVVVNYSHAAGRIGVRVNNGAIVTQVVGSAFQSTSTFAIGYEYRLGGYWNGLMDACAIFSSPPGHGGSLNAEQLAVLWADGAGRAWPF
jgi:Concanavalin A-like lectin/glucanases superfamily